jgi:hypothetical protein
LDETLFEGNARKVENVVQDPETGDIKLFERADYMLV